MDSLRGITMSDWWRLLKQERFAVDPVYLGRAAALTLMARYNSRMKRREDEQFGAAVESAVVPAPLFVLGHWRSGTTLLHELLCNDERYAYPTAFQVSNPHTFLSREDEVARHLEAEAGSTRPMDNVVVTYKSPAEDEIGAAVVSLRSPLIASAFPRRETYYDRYYSFRGVPPAEVAEWRDAFLWFLRKLHVRHGRPMILKSPTHTARVRLLLEIFPDAKFVHIHREPYAVFRSTQKLQRDAVAYSHLHRPRADPNEGILARYRMMYEAFFEERGLIPPGQYCEVAFEELERDPLCQVARIYDELGLGDFDRVQPKIEAYTRDRADYRKNEHRPIASPLRERIAEEWAMGFREWGYPT